MSNTDPIVTSIDVLSSASKTIMNIKQGDGTYRVVKPVTTTEAVIGLDDGKVLKDRLLEIDNNISSNSDSISALEQENDTIKGELESLNEYVEPFMEDLKSHIEVIDLDDPIENDIFEHVYTEIDGLKLYIDKHAEAVDTDNPIENDIFEHVYAEIDALTDKYNQLLNTVTKNQTLIDNINSRLDYICSRMDITDSKLDYTGSELDLHKDNII